MHRATHNDMPVPSAVAPAAAGHLRGSERAGDGSGGRGRELSAHRGLRLRLVTMLAFLLLVACDSEAQKDYEAAQKVDTSEAYDAFVQKHPDSDLVRFALMKLDDYHFEQARLKNDEATWRRFIEQHGQGKHAAEGQAALEQLLYFQALDQGTREALQSFVEAFPSSSFTPIMKKRLENFAVLSKLTFSGPSIAPANLQDNPRGPKDGTGFFATLTNGSELELKRVIVKLVLLTADGRVWDQREIVPVMGAGEWGPKAYKSPLKPGAARKFSYVTARLPEDWKQGYRLYVLSFE